MVFPGLPGLCGPSTPLLRPFHDSHLFTVWLAHQAASARPSPRLSANSCSPLNQGSQESSHPGTASTNLGVNWKKLSLVGEGFSKRHHVFQMDPLWSAGAYSYWLRRTNHISGVLRAQSLNTNIIKIKLHKLAINYVISKTKVILKCITS